MAQIHWRAAVSGDFSNAADWTGGVVPTDTDIAILNAAGNPYTVAVTVQSVAGLQIASNATISVATVGGLRVWTGLNDTAAYLQNAGTISVADHGGVQTGGTIDNSGAIQIDSSGQWTDLQINTVRSGAAVTLVGGGTVTMGDNANNYIDGNETGPGGQSWRNTLENVDNTISGAGVIGDKALPGNVVSYMELQNDAKGVINATGVNALILATGGTTGGAGTINAGLIEATGAGGIVFESSVANTGLLLAAKSSILTMVGVEVDQTGSGTVQVAAGARLQFGPAGRPGLILGGTVKSAGVISGSGRLGNGTMTVVNEATGVIVGIGGSLTIDTGSTVILNAGEIAANAQASTVVDSAVNNSGFLFAAGGDLTANGAVTGAGYGQINGGTLDFASTFNGKVYFTGSRGGVLELGHSQAYGGTISHFSTTGTTSFDLRDIGFVNTNEATYSGNAKGGVLTVTDGTHTAHINMSGDYLGSTFVASSDGHGGTTVVDPTAASVVQRFIAASADVPAAAAASHAPAVVGWRAPTLSLARPAIL